MRKGRGLMRKDLGKNKRGSKENEQKRTIWCRQDAADYAGKMTLAVRVFIVGNYGLLTD